LQGIGDKLTGALQLFADSGNEDEWSGCHEPTGYAFFFLRSRKSSCSFPRQSLLPFRHEGRQSEDGFGTGSRMGS
jgi:hypothetical protein